MRRLRPAIVPAALLLTAALVAGPAPARADIWQTDPGIAVLRDIDAVREWQGRPHLCGRITDLAGLDHRFVFRHEADGTFTDLLPDHQTPFLAPSELIVFQDQLLAAGRFRLADAQTGQTLTHLARWDGAAWRPLDETPPAFADVGPGVPAQVRAVLAVGDRLYLAGAFAGIDGVAGTRNVAVWQDGAFTALGAGLPRIVHSLLWHDGQLWAGSLGELNQPTSVSLWRWDGAAWQPAATYADLAVIHAMIVHGGELLIGGLDLGAGVTPIKRRTAGGGWEPATAWQSGFAQVLALATYRDDLVAGGVWAPAPGMPVNKVARWDGTAWRGLGLEFAPQGGIEGISVTGRRLWLAGDVRYDTRRGLALWVDRTGFRDVHVEATGGDGGEPAAWTFAWTCDLPADPGSHRLDLWADGAPLPRTGADATLQVTVAATADGAWRHTVTTAAPPGPAPAAVTWTASFAHYHCRQKLGPRPWSPPSRPLAAGGGVGALAIGAVPNPFNPATTLHVSVPRPGPVQVAVFDVRGRLVRLLVDGRQAAGPLTVRWDGRDVAGRPAGAGRYLARARMPGATASAAMTLVK